MIRLWKFWMVNINNEKRAPIEINKVEKECEINFPKL